MKSERMYLAGDIGRVKATGLMSKISSWMMRRIFVPDTEAFHHFVIRSFIPDESDYEIKEAISSGVREGRLSWYKDYEIYRLPVPEAVANGELACAKYSRHGRASYDYILFAKIFMGVIVVETKILWHEHHFRKIHCAELPYARDNHFVCTEVAYEITWLMGAPILPWYVVSLPPAIQEVINAGGLVKVTEETP